MFKHIFLSILILITLGCSAVGVVSSNDPEVKINQAYSLLDSGRAIPARRLFEEVIQIAQKRNDIVLEARGLTGLGDLYRSSIYGALKENLTDYKKSISKYEEGASKFIQAGYYKRAAQSYLGAAWAAHSDKDKKATCAYYKKSLVSYQKSGADKRDGMNPSMDSEKKPFPQYINEFQKKDGC